MAIRALSANKLRSILTIIGVAIGIASVVVIYAICLGGRKVIISQINQLGPNLVAVYQAGGTLKNDDVEEIVRGCGNEIIYSAPVLYYYGKIEYKGKIRYMNIMGTTPEYKFVRNVELSKGEFLKDKDEKQANRVCVLDEETKEEFFKETEIIGEKIKIEGFKFEVVGMMKKKSGNIWEEFANKEPTIVPLSVIQKFIRRKELQILFLQIKDLKDVEKVSYRIKEILKRKYTNIDNLKVFTLKDAIGMVDKVTKTLIIISSSVAGISLLVGGIGIMNIMLVSVTERTKEIGLRKATGARTKDILLQFLIEAGCISGIGGIIGIIIGVAGGYIAAKLARWEAIISPCHSWIFFSPTVTLVFNYSTPLRVGRISLCTN
jgi:putative ABC transport system permease protein